MSEQQFQRCLAVVCGPTIEGGYSNDPQDPGGPTNHGITLATLDHWRGHVVTADDVKALSLAEATAIYRAWYWNAVAADSLPCGVDLFAFDGGVNMGVGTSARLLQQAAGVTVDGHIGPATLAAVTSADSVALLESLKSRRMGAYRAMPGWAHDGRGWTARVNTITTMAQAWAKGG